jgi:uncharacterized protein YjbJ (UPF0337 family)
MTRFETTSPEEDKMTWDEIKGSWRQYKGRLKEKWGELTDDDLDRIAGKRDQLLGILQNRYGRTREAAENEIREFEEHLTPVGSGMK